MIPEDAPPPAPIGHNNPPSMIETALEMQRAELETFRARRDEIMAAANRKVVVDRETAGDAGDIIKVAGEVWKKLDDERLARSQPFRDAWLKLKAIVDEFWTPAAEAVDELRRRLKEWDDAEEDRIKAQQREQAKAMADMRRRASRTAAKPPAPPAEALPPKRRKIHGDLGATVSRVDKVEFEVVDVRLVPDWILNSPTVKAAIVEVVRSTAKHIPEIPGITRNVVRDSQVR